MLTFTKLEVVDKSVLLEVSPDVADPVLRELRLASHVVLLQCPQHPQPLHCEVLKHLQAEQHGLVDWRGEQMLGAYTKEYLESINLRYIHCGWIPIELKGRIIILLLPLFPIDPSPGPTYTCNAFVYLCLHLYLHLNLYLHLYLYLYLYL